MAKFGRSLARGCLFGKHLYGKWGCYWLFVLSDQGPPASGQRNAGSPSLIHPTSKILPPHWPKRSTLWPLRFTWLVARLRGHDEASLRLIVASWGWPEAGIRAGVMQSSALSCGTPSAPRSVVMWHRATGKCGNSGQCLGGLPTIWSHILAKWQSYGQCGNVDSIWK